MGTPRGHPRGHGDTQETPHSSWGTWGHPRATPRHPGGTLWGEGTPRGHPIAPRGHRGDNPRCHPIAPRGQSRGHGDNRGTPKSHPMVLRGHPIAPRGHLRGHPIAPREHPRGHGDIVGTSKCHPIAPKGHHGDTQGTTQGTRGTWGHPRATPWYPEDTP